MDTAERRSPLRILAPVALIVFALALVVIISSANDAANDLAVNVGGSRARFVLARRAADGTETPQLLDNHGPAPHRRGKQQDQHAFDDDIGIQE